MKEKQIKYNADKMEVLIRKSAELIVQEKCGTASLLQRRLYLGYNKADVIIDHLENMKIIGEFRGTKERKILVNKIKLEEILISNKL